jgi:hypothetical protein
MTTKTTTTIKTITNLKTAYDGSYYTILGAGGDLNDWVEGLTKMLVDENIGTPSAWFTTTGGKVNKFARLRVGGELRYDDEFPDDLVVLMFPLDGLDIGRLAIFKLKMQDRWFDDVIQNMKGA